MLGIIGVFLLGGFVILVLSSMFNGNKHHDYGLNELPPPNSKLPEKPPE